MTSSALGSESLRTFAEAHAPSDAVSVRATDRSVARTIWMVSITLYLALATGTALTRQPY